MINSCFIAKSPRKSIASDLDLSNYYWARRSGSLLSIIETNGFQSSLDYQESQVIAGLNRSDQGFLLDLMYRLFCLTHPEFLSGSPAFELQQRLKSLSDSRDLPELLRERFPDMSFSLNQESIWQPVENRHSNLLGGRVLKRVWVLRVESQRACEVRSYVREMSYESVVVKSQIVKCYLGHILL